MAFNNRNNLNPQSAPWGREVEQKIEINTRDLAALRALTENNNKATNATISTLSTQQQRINTASGAFTERVTYTYQTVPSTTFEYVYTHQAVAPDWASSGHVLVTSTVGSYTLTGSDYVYRYISVSSDDPLETFDSIIPVDFDHAAAEGTYKTQTSSGGYLINLTPTSRRMKFTLYDGGTFGDVSSRYEGSFVISYFWRP